MCKQVARCSYVPRVCAESWQQIQVRETVTHRPTLRHRKDIFDLNCVIVDELPEHQPHHFHRHTSAAYQRQINASGPRAEDKPLQVQRAKGNTCSTAMRIASCTHSQKMPARCLTMLEHLQQCQRGNVHHLPRVNLWLVALHVNTIAHRACQHTRKDATPCCKACRCTTGAAYLQLQLAPLNSCSATRKLNPGCLSSCEPQSTAVANQATWKWPANFGRLTRPPAPCCIIICIMGSILKIVSRIYLRQD